jgi:endonuclease/exonuclease/phosphatase family metal-dependent hydrolase
MGGVLRVLSANLWNGAADPEGFAALVRGLDADVACVQELTAAQAEALSEVLPHGRLDPDDQHRGLGIALRRPGAVRCIPLPCRDARVTELVPADWPGLEAPVEIVNVHIASPTARPLRRQPGVRRGQLRALLAYLDAGPPRPRAVLGDFNATPVWPVYRRMASRLRDVALEHARARGRRPARTWPRWRWWPGPQLLRIDHCFAQELRVEDCEVLPVAGSDHCALRVDFALP